MLFIIPHHSSVVVQILFSIIELPYFILYTQPIPIKIVSNKEIKEVLV